MEDVRIVKSKREIESAFIKLLSEKDFNKITIKDICNASLTSRSTFYTHYYDKYDLLEKIVSEYALIIRNLIEERFALSDMRNIGDLLQYAYSTYFQHKEPIMTLMAVHIPKGDLREEIEQILFKNCFHFLENKHNDSDIPILLISSLYTSAVVTMINWILEYGIDEQALQLVNGLQAYIFDKL